MVRVWIRFLHLNREDSIVFSGIEDYALRYRAPS